MFIRLLLAQVTNNSASGGYSGFFYPVLPRPVGLSRKEAIVPSSRPLLLFEGNVAHSSSYQWLNAGRLWAGCGRAELGGGLSGFGAVGGQATARACPQSSLAPRSRSRPK